jgi:hypothetical protein
MLNPLKITVGLLVSLFVLAVPAAAQDCGGCATKAPGEARPCHYLEVQSLVPDGPSAAAGILVGDVLSEYDKRTVGCSKDLNVARSLAVGESIPVTFKRGDRVVDFVLPKGKLGIYFKEWMFDVVPGPDAKVIPGVPQLGWEKPNSFIGALEAVQYVLGDRAEYVFLSGVSGAAFRIQFFDTWCPSSPDATVGFDAAKVAMESRGLSWKELHVSSDGKNKPQIIKEVMASIDAGMPVLAIDLVESPEWGVITGYQKQGQEFFCRTYFDKRKGYELATRFPFAAAILKQEGKAPDEDAGIRQGFDIVAENLAAPKYGEYFSGLAAFDKWVERLKTDDFAALDSIKLANVAQANRVIFSRLVADRKTGLAYIAAVAKDIPKLAARLADLTALYQREIDLLGPLTDSLPGMLSVTKPEQWPQGIRDRQIAALTQARSLEAQALPIWQELAGKK